MCRLQCLHSWQPCFGGIMPSRSDRRRDRRDRTVTVGIGACRSLQLCFAIQNLPSVFVPFCVCILSVRASKFGAMRCDSVSEGQAMTAIVTTSASTILQASQASQGLQHSSMLMGTMDCYSRNHLVTNCPFFCNTISPQHHK
jgi:hypothetical protein